MSDSQNEQNTGGAGDEGTIPDTDSGLAVGVSEGAGTTFEPEEDPAGAAGTDSSGTGADEDADAEPRPDSHNAETTEDTASGGPA